MAVEEVDGAGHGCCKSWTDKIMTALLVFKEFVISAGFVQFIFQVLTVFDADDIIVNGVVKLNRSLDVGQIISRSNL